MEQDRSRSVKNVPPLISGAYITEMSTDQDWIGLDQD